MRSLTGLAFILVYTLNLSLPNVSSLQIRNITDRGLTGSHTLIYRRRLTGRSKDSIYPQTSPRSQVESKTELYPVTNHVNSYTEETVEPKSYSSTSAPKIPKALRRNRSRLRSAPQQAQQIQYPVQSQQETVEYPELTPATKQLKVKSGRRRKVKRPNKAKPPVATKVSEEDLGAGSGKGNSSSSGGGDKNLALEIGSDDGKYALIDKFFEVKPSKAPGVISYAPSDDFASDNQYTLGNVKENDIWLSDGHLLVLKGGDLDASLREHWKPIDNYQRGNRPPLKIALDSNNPPPFPVFINDTGPPVFLGPLPPFGLPYPPPGAFNESFDPSRLPPPGMIPLFPNGTIPPEYFGPPPFPLGNNSRPLYPGPPGQGGYGQGGYGQGGYGPPGGGYGPGAGKLNGSFPGPFPPFRPGPGPGGIRGNNTFPPPPFFPFPPQGNRNGSFPPHFLPPPPGFNPNISGGPPPGYPLLPPLVLNPNDNETDDPSIFLPPPYDFDYQDDNSTLVPPGPFAPGLVVPPPKDFYTVYNKTVKPTLPPTTGLSAYFGKRPQRPNGKKPKFPITNPPDDSEEADLPIVSTPFPYRTESPYKKRKQRPGKKELFGSKYESEENGDQNPIIPNGIPAYPISPVSQSPLISPPRGITLIPTNTLGSTTKKPLNQFLYVRGQLKSLAELNAEREIEYEYAATPRPPFDERGYPSRIIDENEPPTVLQYHKSKTTGVPAKSFYYNTPKYDAIYNTVAPKKQKTTIKHTLLKNYDSNGNPIVHPSQPPPEQESPVIYINNLNRNHLSNNQGQGLYNHANSFQDKVTPTYYNRPNNNNNNNGGGQPQPQQQRPLQQHQIIELQSPKSFPATSQRQPHLYNHASPPQNLNFPTNSVFRPAFGPQSNQEQERSKVLFPGEVRQSGPIYNFQPPALYQQQPNRPQINGYYSPISQYYQPFDQSQVQHPQTNNFYQSQSGIDPDQGRFYGNQNSINRRPPTEYIFAKTQDQPYFTGGQGRSAGNNAQQQPTSPFNSQVNQFLPQLQQPGEPIQQNVYGSYR